MSKPTYNTTVTVLMPVFNAQPYLAESIESVVKQTYQNWELIAVNDGSTDSSLEILTAYSATDSRIKTYSQDNLGATAARAHAIKHASGEFVTYLDADDKLSKDFLELTVKRALSSKADIVIPTLIAEWDSPNCYNFNKHNNLEISQITSMDAFLRSIPWRIHGLNLYRTKFFKHILNLDDVRALNTYNADEFLTRTLLISAQNIVFSGGQYFYRKNSSSTTRKFTARHCGALETNEAIYKLALAHQVNPDQLIRIANCFEVERSNLKRRYIKHWMNLEPHSYNQFHQELSAKRNWEQNVKLKINKIPKMQAVHLIYVALKLLSVFFKNK